MVIIPKQQYHFRIATGLTRERAMKLHYQRYVEVGFLKRGENDPYAPDAVYFAALTCTEEAVGTTRLIFRQLGELPTIKHFQLHSPQKAKLQELAAHQLAEVSAFTKLPEHDVALGLIRAALHYCMAKRITHWICCIDERVYNYMHRIFHFPFEIIGEPRIYLGSVSIPCLLNLSECLELLRTKRYSLYQYLLYSHDNDLNQEVIV